jgi:uncharacterized alkaline shock family protein YloU
MAAGAALIIAGTDSSRLHWCYSFLNAQSTGQRIILCVAGVLVVFVALAMLLFALASAPKKVTAILLPGGQGGQVSISAEAVRSMVGKAVGQIRGVREVKSTVSNGSSGVKVRIDLAIVGEENFLTLSNQVQTMIKEYLTQVGGLRVEEVVVLISESTAPVKAVVPAEEPQAEAGQEG